MVSRVTTALMLALAASTEAAASASLGASAPRRMLSPSGGLGGGDLAAPQDAARALAAAEGEVAALTAPRRALAPAAADRLATEEATMAGFVTVAPNGTTFELDGRKFIAVGANQCACPERPAAARRERARLAFRHVRVSSTMTRHPAARRGARRLLRLRPRHRWAPRRRARSVGASSRALCGRSCMSAVAGHATTAFQC